MNAKSVSKVSASNTPDSEVDGEDVIQATLDGRGVTVMERADDRVVAPDVEDRVVVSIATDIIDRYEGMADTWAVWGPATNREFVARQLANPRTLKIVTDFLSNRSLDPAMQKMIAVPAFKPSETMFTKPQVFAAIVDTVPDRSAAHVIMEIITPGLIELGVISPNGRFAQQVAYPFKRVTVQALAVEVAMIQAFNALSNVRLSTVRKDQRQSKTVFAQDFAEVYRPIGLALGQTYELATVVDDIVRGVRAHLTPPGSPAAGNLSVPSHWYNNPQIAEFAGCLPFVRAALAISSTEIIRLENEGSNLDQWLRLVVNMLRESSRYQWITKAESLRHYTIRKVRDVRGKPVSIIAHRSVKADPIAQSVIATRDVIMGDADAYDITPTKDRISQVIQSAYGKADFSTDNGANLLFGTASDLSLMGFNGLEAGFLVDAYGYGTSLSDLAALVADRVYVPFVDNTVVLSARTQEMIQRRNENREQDLDLEVDFDPQWWFSVATQERLIDVQSGTHFGDAILTSDPVEALIAARDIEARDALPARKQLLGPNAFSARVMSFDRTAFLQETNARYGFAINVNGESVSGAFKASSFSSLRASASTLLVKPRFNASVITTMADCFAMSLLLIQKAQTSDEWAPNTGGNTLALAQLQERVAIKLLQLAQGLSPAFREEVQHAVIERVLVATKAKAEEALVMRASLIQDYFTAYCDVIALDFFLFLQGINVNGWGGLIRSEALERICLTMGSDRKMNAYIA